MVIKKSFKIKKNRKNYTRSYTKYTNLGVKKKSSFGKLFKLFAKFSAVVCVIVALVYCYKFTTSYLYANENFFINDIEVIGCKNVTETEIKKLIPFKVGDSLLAINLSDTEKELQNYKPELKDVSMSRKWKEKKVVISLKEREPEVFIIKEDKKIGVDFDNKPFALRGNMFDMKIPVLTYQNAQERQNLLNFVKKIKTYMSDLMPNITEIKYGDIEDIVFVIDGKTVVFWGLPQDNVIKDKSEKFKIVLNDSMAKYKSIDYIDLSFIDDNRDKIIVKPSFAEDLTKA